MNFEQDIDELNKINNKKLDSKYLTLYLDVSNRSFKQLKTQISSLLKRQDALAHSDELLNSLQADMANFKFSGPGLGYFVLMKNDKVAFSKLVDLPIKLKIGMHIGKIFDLGYLSHANSILPDSLVVNLGNRSTRISVVKPDELIELTEITKSSEQSRPKHSGARGRFGLSIFYGDKSDDSPSKAEFDYVKQIQHSINSTIDKYKPEVVFMYAPSAFRYADDLAEEVLNKDIELVKIRKNLKKVNPKQLMEILRFSRKQQISADLDKAKSNQMTPMHLRELVKAVRMGRVKKLYLRNFKLSKPGYIIRKSFPYPYAVRTSRKVENIIPWITKRVLDTNGEVVLKPDMQAKYNAVLHY